MDIESFAAVSVIFLFVSLWLTFLFEGRLMKIVTAVVTGVFLLFFMLYAVFGKETVSTVSGAMQMVDGQYFHWSGEYGDKMSFYALADDGVTIECVPAKVYTIYTSDDKAYTYESRTVEVRFLFLFSIESEYVFYVPAGDAVAS